jgi:hypothetical protein
MAQGLKMLFALKIIPVASDSRSLLTLSISAWHAYGYTVRALEIAKTYTRFSNWG